MKRKSRNWKCSCKCMNHKLCARYDGRGGNHKAYCLPDFLRYGFIKKGKNEKDREKDRNKVNI